MPDAPDPSPLAQIAVLVASTVGGVLVYFFGRRAPKDEPDQQSNSILVEIERMRVDLQEVVAKHREAIDNRHIQQGDSISRMFGDLERRIFEALKELEKRVREIEIKTAKLEERRPRR